MKKDEVCDRIRKVGIIPAIRVSSSEDARFAAEAVASGGIPIVEITMTVPGAIELIGKLIREDTSILVGAGTVLNIDTARQCEDVGANFITAPGFNRAIVEFAAKESLAVLPGGLTPTEVVDAWAAGADFVKVFPCAAVGGDKYIKALKTALPQIPMIAAGGVNQRSAANLIVAGAEALGVGRELIPPDAILLRKADRIRELSHRFAGFVREGRERLRV
jgi:2-dehydro-3-deoxyphosphogluconate aldolase / (4S)-4-hydroxy-2-oxoglutarate aldolase